MQNNTFRNVYSAIGYWLTMATNVLVIKDKTVVSVSKFFHLKFLDDFIDTYSVCVLIII